MTLNTYTTALLALTSIALTGCADDYKGQPDTPGSEYTPHNVAVEVLDYSPMPGQFVNELPEIAPNADAVAVRRAVQQSLDRGNLICLGGFGGSVTLRLKTPILHSPQAQGDFRVLGNAFYWGTSTYDGMRVGSSEPGVVCVMEDVNRNGKADDTWYYLRGARWEQARVTTVTYTDNSAAGDNDAFVLWSADDGTSGVLSRNAAYHNHAFFPSWGEKTSTMSVTAMRLPDNHFLVGGTYVGYCYTGYADSCPNDQASSALSLANAVDADGNPANIRRIDFVKIHTGVLQCNGPLGEVSTEISGIQALHN